MSGVPDLVTVLGPLAVALAIVAAVLLDARRVRTRAVATLRTAWGAGAQREQDGPPPRRLFDLAGPPAADTFVLDERTWADLDLDAVVRRLDGSVSPLGSHALYRMVRSTSLSEPAIAARRALVDELGGDAALRNRLFSALYPLADPRAARAIDAAWSAVPVPPRWTALAPPLALAQAALVAAAWGGFLSWGWLVPAFLAASLLHFTHQRRVGGVPFASLAAALGAARAIAASGDLALLRLAPTLSADVSRTAPLRRRLAPLAFDDSLGLAQYVKIFFLVDVIAYRRSRRELVAHGGALQRQLDAVATLDALLGVAAFLAGRRDSCAPRFTAEHDAWAIADARHPLLEHPVGNDYRPGARGALITGSNMAGKTTFLKTIGVNAVLAQSLGLALAGEWRMPLLRVVSSIGRADNLIAGRSYYMAEVESVLRLVRASESVDVHLLLADEVFRGTNPDERVAGAVAVLRYLVRGPHVVLAATHDLELVGELADRYDAFHFGDTLAAAGLAFDFTMRPGPCASRNAIALLAHAGYPAELVESARSASRAAACCAARLEEPSPRPATRPSSSTSKT